MFRFIRNKMAAAVESIKSMAAHLLLNSIEKDRRWAIKALLWLGADCSGKYTSYLYENGCCSFVHDHKFVSILSVAIQKNRDLALWLLNIPAIQKHAHDNENNFLMELIFYINRNEFNIRNSKDKKQKFVEEKDLLIKIQDKLLDCKFVRDTMVIDAFNKYILLESVIKLANDKNFLHANNNHALKMAFYKGNQRAFNEILSSSAVKDQLKTDINNDFNDDNLRNYLMSEAPEHIYIPGLTKFIKMIKQALGMIPQGTTEHYNSEPIVSTFMPMHTESQKQGLKNSRLTVSQQAEMYTTNKAIAQAAIKFNGV